MKPNKIFFLLLLALMPASLDADPVGVDKARKIAEEFFSSTMTRADNSEMYLLWSGNDIKNHLYTKASSAQGDGELLYIFNSSDRNGYVIIAGDDNVNPVVGYSFDRSFDVENVPDALADLLASWSEYISDMRSAPSITQVRSAEHHPGNVVKKYETAKWSQGEPFNGLLPIYGGKRSITGCVATASSILMKHFNWPVKGVGVIPSYSYVDVFGTGRTVQEVALGHQYDYANMLMDYSGSYSSVQAEAVATLMRDAGAAVQMEYSYLASSASTIDMLKALTSYFGFSKEARIETSDTYINYEWQEKLKNNIRNCGPTPIGASGKEGRHMFILDGYTTDGYFSINFGWGGLDDGYYLLPEAEYNMTYEAIVGLVPDRDGSTSYCDDIKLKAIFDNAGNAVYKGLYGLSSEFSAGQRFDLKLGAVINCAPVEFEGSLRLSLTDAEGQIVEETVWGPYEYGSLAPFYYFYFDSISAKVSVIEEGYRLRLYYKGKYSDQWKWARSYDLNSYDELILCATPEDVARLLSVTISKTEKRFTFSSSLPLSYIVRDSDDSTVASGTASSFTETVIDMSGFTSGEYIFSFASGGDPYTFTLVL